VTFIERLLDIESKFSEVIRCVSAAEAAQNQPLRAKTKAVSKLLMLIDVFKQNLEARKNRGGHDKYDANGKKRRFPTDRGRSRHARVDSDFLDSSGKWRFNRQIFSYI
jgi:hypothetical protein